MCFICKLSFGNTKSFRLHASSEHQLTLQSKEQQLLNREYSSVIIQPPNMDERPEISFLEPIDMLNVIKSDDLNTATDVEFNENTSQVVTHEFNTGDTSMTVRPAVKKLINEIAEDMTATTGANSSMLSMKASIPTSTSPPTSTTMSTDLTLSSVKSPKCSRSATATLPAVSQIASTFEPNGTIDCSNNSNFLRVNSLSECARQKPRYEATAFVNDSSVITATTVSNHPSGISKPNSIENQQQETIIITNRLKTATVETQETDDSKAKVATSSPSLPSSLTFLSPSSFPLSLLPKNESEDVSKTEVTVFGSSSDSTLKAKLTVCETPPTASATRNNRSSNTGNRNLLGDREDCYSSPLCTVTKMENIEMGSTTATSANVSDILHMNLHRDSPTVDDNKLDRSETQSRLSEDAVNFHQQQQQFAAMSSSTFASPSPSLISMTPTANNLSSLHASLVALNDGFPTTCDSTDPQKTGARIISDFLQQHLSLQHQQQYGALNGKCAEHSDYKDNDYKNCEIQQLKSSPHHNQGHQHTLTNTNTTPQRSPSRSSNSGTSTIMRSPANSTTSPNATIVNVSAAAVAAAASQQQNTVAAVAVAAAAAAAAVVSVASNNSSFTIGACSDHMNGRPLGVECTRCEMILNSTRLNTGVQMSTRNSCKTLKCPQCNWHYKYQETLEIHMREKHPDGESACGYCLSGQNTVTPAPPFYFWPWALLVLSDTIRRFHWRESHILPQTQSERFYV
ncbi:zinc finger protein 2-like [Anastrepha ludens]|uniref:zinc finger protein 2-like n=1 Tax=Anastrepha ludens TaxID=28586 RepID=UPI0023B13A23|nr:zinc finger protein 2-like [Anastrepha ludens]